MTARTAQTVIPVSRSSGELTGNRLRELRLARGWSLTRVAGALMAAATDEERKRLPDVEGLRRNWARWESGAVIPDGNRSAFFRPIIARMLGVAPGDLFPAAPEPAGGSGTVRRELLARRSQVREELLRLESELAYLNTVLAIPVPDTQGMVP
jgi:transcriptional regulator with XRE-family HTH domain